MTPDELFQRLRFSSRLVTGAILTVLGGAGFGVARVVWGSAGMPEWALVATVGLIGYGAGMVGVELLRLGRELHDRRRARQFLRAGDHRRAVPVVRRLMRNSAYEEGRSDPTTLRWQLTYAHVLARLGRVREAEDLLVDVVERYPGPAGRGPARPAVVAAVHDQRSEPVEIWWPALDVREVGRRIAQSRAVQVLYAGMVLAAVAVGIAVLVGGADAVPSWMRSVATAVGLGLVLTLVQVPMQAWTERGLVRQVDRLLATGDHEGAASNVEAVVGRQLQRGGPEDPEALRWMTTLAHLQLLLGRDRDALELLSVLRMEQQRLHGPRHPDLARTERVIAAAMAGNAARTPVETWWTDTPAQLRPP
jgi:hypothetical protein